MPRYNPALTPLGKALDGVMIGVRDKGLEPWMIVSTTHAPFFLKDVLILRIPGMEGRTPRPVDYIGWAVIETEGRELLVNPRGVETEGWDLLVNPWGAGVGMRTGVVGHGWLGTRCRVGGA